jgi:hypothetical protein
VPAQVHLPSRRHGEPEPRREHEAVVFRQPPDEMLTNIQAIFIVRPNIQNDIYELFVRSSSSKSTDSHGGIVFHNFAHIPNYKTSVLMNEYFRKIAENKRLDALEESDDESDFENTDVDRFVSLDKEYMFVCRFHKRFCRWVPIQMLASTQSKTMPLDSVITYQQVRQHEVKYLKNASAGANANASMKRSKQV